MMVASTKNDFIRIGYKDSRVIITDEDEDRFFISAQNAVKACRMHDYHEKAMKAFKEEILRPVIEWYIKNQDRVKQCYIPAPGKFIEIFVVDQNEEVDFDFSKIVHSLAFDFCDKGWNVNVYLIPPSEDDNYSIYFDPQGAIRICHPTSNMKQS